MSWLPIEWPKTVVMLERAHWGEKGLEFRPIGSGFITEYKTVNILVTCKHVIFNHQENQAIDELFISFNLRQGGRARRQVTQIKEQFKVDWFFDTTYGCDLALIPYPIDEESDDVRRMAQDLYESPDALYAADDIFFLGYPLGLEGGIETPVSPVVRAGIISLIQADKNFLIDAHVFPGNSGSPVFLKPTLIDFKTATFRAAKFIGIIQGYIPYLDTAISTQTKRPRVVFEENSGLARVISAQYIQHIFSSDHFQQWIAKL